MNYYLCFIYCIYEQSLLYILNFRLGKDTFAQARAAAKIFTAQESTDTKTGIEGRTTDVKTAKLRKESYVPTFTGTVSNPSPLWASRSQTLNP